MPGIIDNFSVTSDQLAIPLSEYGLAITLGFGGEEGVRIVERKGEKDHVSRDSETNLAVRTMYHFIEKYNVQNASLEVKFDSTIPKGSGLGVEEAQVIGAAMVMNKRMNLGLTSDDLLKEVVSLMHEFGMYRFHVAHAMLLGGIRLMYNTMAESVRLYHSRGLYIVTYGMTNDPLLDLDEVRSKQGALLTYALCMSKHDLLRKIWQLGDVLVDKGRFAGIILENDVICLGQQQHGTSYFALLDNRLKAEKLIEALQEDYDIVYPCIHEVLHEGAKII